MDLRTSATAVASALHHIAMVRGVTPHQVLAKWAKLATDNPLPEIRLAWDAHD